MRKTILFIAIAFLAGCSSQKVVVATDSRFDASSAMKYQYENTQKAFEDFAIDSTLNRLKDEKDRDNVNFFRCLSEGDDANAQVLFDKCAASDTGFVRERLSFFAMHYYRGTDWKKIEELERKYKQITFFHDFVTAFSNINPFNVSFPLSDSVSIPFFKGSFSNSPIVELMVNGKRKKFLIDTGFSFTTISPETAKDCGIEAVRDSLSSSLQDANGFKKKDAGQYCSIKEMAIGDLRVKNHSVIIARNANLRIAGVKLTNYDGILGWNFLQNFRVRIDWRNNRFTLSRSLGSDSSMTPRVFYSITDPFVRLKLSNGRYANFHLDTGANDVTLFNSIETKYKCRNPKHRRSFDFGVVSNIFSKKVYYPDFSFLINGKLFVVDEVGKENRNEKLYFINGDGRIGTSLFKGRCLTFDYKSGLFEVE